MPGKPRSPQRRAQLERWAKALRAGGATMAEVERETGVPVSTLHQWAARGRWRLEDLEGTHPVIPDAEGDPGPADLSGAPSEADGGPGSAPGPCPGLAGTTGEEDGSSCPPTPEHLRSASEAAFAAALRMAEAGQARAAREQLLLGRRFLDAAGAMAPKGTKPGEPVIENPYWTYQDPRKELEHRLLKLLDYELRQLAKAADAIGVESVRGLDISAFELAEGQYREATPEEAAKIEAGDWPKLPVEDVAALE